MALDLETWQNPPNVISVISSFEDGDKAIEQGQLDHRLGLLGIEFTSSMVNFRLWLGM